MLTLWIKKTYYEYPPGVLGPVGAAGAVLGDAVGVAVLGDADPGDVGAGEAVGATRWRADASCADRVAGVICSEVSVFCSILLNV